MKGATRDVRPQAPARGRVPGLIVPVLLAAVHLWTAPVPPAEAVSHASAPRTVTASIETDAVSHGFDAADDAAIWVHPGDPARSTIIGTDKKGGLLVYDLQGRMLHELKVGRMNNVDLRYNFPLGGERVDLVVASDRSRNAIAVYRVVPASRSLVSVAEAPIPVSVKAYGICMYRSRHTGRFYAFVVGRKGRIEQFELQDNGRSRVRGTLVRELPLESRGEGCVADDELGHLYVGEEKVGIWKFAAEPTGSRQAVQIDSTRRPGRLTSDVEGLTLYYASEGGGYLIASSQGSNEFMVYERGGSNRFVMRFRIATGLVDAVTETDGIAVLGFGLGPLFPNGAFVAQDDRNSSEGSAATRRRGRNQNFKLVPWENIAQANTGSPLVVDNTLDPRAF